MKSWRIRKLSLNCWEASRLSAAAEEAELSRFERWGLRIHMFLCGECRRFHEQMQFLRELFAQAPEKFLELGFSQTTRLSSSRAAQIKACMRQARDEEKFS